MCEESRGRAEEECRVLRGKVADLEREHQAARLELNSQVDELKLKVWRHLAAWRKEMVNLFCLSVTAAPGRAGERSGQTAAGGGKGSPLRGTQSSAECQ